MIQKNTLDFLKDLQKNNSKVWFDANKKKYETARATFILSVEEMIAAIKTIDPEIENLTAKDCIFRINRDVRFSKNKSPYKNNMAAYFNRAGKKGTGAGYYMHIEPGNSFAAAGVWMPEKEELSKIRQEIDYNFDEWKKIIKNSVFKKNYEKGLDKTNSLVRPPKGYEEENRAIDFLKLKSFVVSKPFSDTELMSKTFISDLSKTFKAVKPLVDFINRSLD
ncbi:MAG TPA: DUF2461 domain-containing protein [Ferruginibacter sp.]|nr:DUF2461 domain-containing protein [Ferruginibacter sp.]